MNKTKFKINTILKVIKNQCQRILWRNYVSNKYKL